MAGSRAGATAVDVSTPCSGTTLRSGQRLAVHLPQEIREKLDARASPRRQLSLADIQRRLQSAAMKRQDKLRAAKPNSPQGSRPSSTSRKFPDAAERAAKLEERMAAADAARAAHLASRQAAARQASARVEAARQTVARQAVTGAQLPPPAQQAVSSGKAAVLEQHRQAAVCLQRFWRRCRIARRTTGGLAAAFLATGVPTSVSLPNLTSGSGSRKGDCTGGEPPVFGLSMPPSTAHGHNEPAESFDALAAAMAAPATLAAATALLQRLQKRRTIALVGAAMRTKAEQPAMQCGAEENEERQCQPERQHQRHGRGQDSLVGAALARLFPRGAGAKRRLPRYPARIFLCAYMIVEHPLAVFSQRTERELRLAAAAAATVLAFDRLLTDFGGSQASSNKSAAGVAAAEAAFDAAWCGYLELFAVWKGVDAKALEEDLIYAAVELERSVLGLSAGAEDMATSPELQAARQGVADDQHKLRQRVALLTGDAGAARYDAALSVVRKAARGAGGSPAPHTLPLTKPLPPQTTSSNGIPGQVGPFFQPSHCGNDDPHGGSPHGERQCATAEAAAAAARDVMLWELLHDCAFQLPTTEAEAAWSDALGDTHVMQEPLPDPTGLSADAAAAMTRRRVRRIAETAFWATTANDLASNDAPTATKALDRLAGTLNDVGVRLLDVLSDPGGDAAAAVSAVFGAAALQQRLPAAASFLDGPQVAQEVMGILQQGTQLLRHVGAPVRDAQLAAAQAAIRDDLAAAGDDRVARARVVAKAVRMLAAQMDLLHMDVANAHLRMLSVTIAGNTGIRHTQIRFAKLHGLPSAVVCSSAAGHTIAAPDTRAVAASLPRTAAWLAAAILQLPSVKADLDAAAAAAATACDAAPAVPAAAASACTGAGIAEALPPMRTGHGGSMLRQNTRSGSAAHAPDGHHDGQHDSPNDVAASPNAAEQHVDGGGTGTGSPAARLQPGVGLRSWRGAFRTGLVGLVAGEARADDTAALPETLVADATRLGSAQAAFQSLLVTTAALLLLRQHASATRRPLPPGDVDAAGVRLAALLADPKVSLSDVAAELAAAAGRPGDANTEAALQTGLQRLLARSSSGFKALSTGLTTALAARLLADPSESGANVVVAAALARIGASASKPQVEALAVDIAKVAALGEAVHGGIYMRLAAM